MAINGVVAGNYGSKIIDKQYAKQFLIKWYLTTDFRNISSTTYEADLKQGHSVIIRLKPDVAIKAYEANADIVFDNPDTDTVEMDIDQALYFAVAEDKVETQQADMDNLSAWVEDGMKQLEISVEKDCYSIWYTEADAKNAGNTAGADAGYVLGTKAAPVVITNDNIINYIGIHALCLDDYNVPEGERNIVLPKFCRALLAESDVFIDAGKSGDSRTAIKDRYIGETQGFKVYVSNNLDREVDGGTGDDIVYNVFSAHKSALQFAGQLDISASVERESRFDRGNKALFVYGRKATKADGVTHGVITATAIA